MHYSTCALTWGCFFFILFAATLRYDIDEYDAEVMIELINEGMVEAIFEKDVLNPHIKGFELDNQKNIKLRMPKM